jgi:hypothetical protein
VIAHQLTMRAVIKRGAGTDGYGGPSAAQPLAVNPAAKCWVYTRTDRQDAAGGKVVTVGEIVAYFGAGEDVLEGDVIARVADRRDREIYKGPLYVQVVTPRMDGAVVDHKEAVLKRTR